jgi:hypothetical protein
MEFPSLSQAPHNTSSRGSAAVGSEDLRDGSDQREGNAVYNRVLNSVFADEGVYFFVSPFKWIAIALGARGPICSQDSS